MPRDFPLKTNKFLNHISYEREVNALKLLDFDSAYDDYNSGVFYQPEARFNQHKAV